MWYSILMIGMRIFISIFLGWLIYFPLFLISAVLSFSLSGLATEFKTQSKEELMKWFSQNSEDAIIVGLIMLLSSIIAISISSFVAGLLARQKGYLVGSIVSSIVILVSILGTFVRGKNISYSFTYLVSFVVILFLGAAFGFLGEKIYIKRLKR